MYSLVMNTFSWDLIKMEIWYQQCFILVNNYLHVYNVYTAPGILDDRTSILAQLCYQILPYMYGRIMARTLKMVALSELQ